MISSLWAIFILNIGINSFLSFFTLGCLILLALKILRIENPRLYALALLLPFIKIVVDLFSYQFSDWALAQGINPMTCPEGSRTLNVGLIASLFEYPLCAIKFHLEEGLTFSLADLLSLKMGESWTIVCAIGLILGTFGSLGNALHNYLMTFQWIQHLKSHSTLYLHRFHDPLLQATIQHKQVSIYLTQASHSPFISSQRKPTIFISRFLFDQLLPHEFEAVVAHEMAHHRHGDLMINLLLFWICNFFWWIPSHFFKTKLELAQEYACDRLPNSPSLRLHLAEALYKASLWLQTPSPLLAQPFAASHHATKRLKALLSPHKNELRGLKWMKIMLLFSIVFLLALGKFWIF